MKKGLFWFVNSELITKFVECNAEGMALEDVEYTSKSGENFNHKIEWENLSKEITKGKEYNYFPRGRVEINKGKITIFLNPDINSEDVINKVIEEFELQDIENIRIVTDGSRHYEYQRMFDYEFKINNKLINVEPPRLCSRKYNVNIYRFGYVFNDNLTVEKRKEFINNILESSDLKQFIELPLAELGKGLLYGFDSFVFPISNRNKLTQKMIETINECLDRETAKIGYESIYEKSGRLGCKILILDDMDEDNGIEDEVISIVCKNNCQTEIFMYKLFGADPFEVRSGNVLNLKYEWNIDITIPQFSIFDKLLIDTADAQLDELMERMCEQFYNADYKLINKPRYAYDLACNYISFIFERRLKNLKKIIVNVGIRVSESPEVQKVEILFNRKICSNYCMALSYVREQLILFE